MAPAPRGSSFLIHRLPRATTGHRSPSAMLRPTSILDEHLGRRASLRWSPQACHRR
jgi:hypothetical protein